MEKNTVQFKLAESSRKFKDNTAIDNGERVITYGCLEKRSNETADWILEKGIKKGAIIAILLEDRLEFIIAMIGILKAGGVFVPLDSDLPKSRLALMLNSVDTEYITSTDTYWKTGESGKEPKVGFINPEEILAREKETGGLFPAIDVPYSPDDKVYIYFTSGTTGTPKAIMGKNKSLLHFIRWEIDTFGINETFRFSQFTNPGFDVYLRDILVPLCAGAAICIPDNKELMTSGEELARWLERKKIQLVHCVPSLFRLINTPALKPGAFKTLKYILFAGEKVIPKEMANWYRLIGDRVQLVNLYGPTETTLAKLFYFIQPSDIDRKIMPVGKPIRGARVIILDTNLEICDSSVTGEIYIRTPYRSFGYYNDPGLTRKKFVKNPFTDDPNDIIYKTGDLGRFLPDGNIELLGRIDRQVKIRGMRVELDEIENVLLKFPSVKEAVVVLREISEQNGFLVGLITATEAGRSAPEPDGTFIPGLKQYLSERLPAYMVPADIVLVEEIPRKINGKVDYDKISDLVEHLKTEYTAPENPVEKKLAVIWSELLGFQRIGIHNSFFELGGNSLNMMSLIVKIHKEFNLRITLGEVFKNNTIQKQAQFIMAAARDKYAAIENVEKKEYYPLSSAQKRLYILQQMELNNVNYNLPTAVIFREAPQKEKLLNIFKKLITRHESLRTSFHMITDRPVQIINEAVDITVDFHNAGTAAREKDSGEYNLEIDEWENHFVKPFDLSHAPLLRVTVINLGEEYLLLVDMHHIISDRSAQKILVKDFTGLYLGEELPQLRLQYKDYSQWQNKESWKKIIQSQKEYWISQYTGDIPLLDLPTDYPRTKNREYKGDEVNFPVNEAELEALKSLGLEEDATLFMILLAVFNILLSKYTQQEDIVVGSTIEGRNHAGLKNIIGMFVNMLALRNSPGKNQTFRDFLQEVKRNVLNAYENQDYQFDELVGTVAPDKVPGRHPLFDVVFDFHYKEGYSKPQEPLESPGIALEKSALDISPYPLNPVTSRFDLIFGAVVTKEMIFISFTYSANLFKKDTIERLGIHLKNIITEVIQNPQTKIFEIKMLADEEKEQILEKIKSRDSKFLFNDIPVDQTQNENLTADFDF